MSSIKRSGHSGRTKATKTEAYCICFRSSASQVSLDGPTSSQMGPNHDRGTISVEQSSCCSTETRDDSAHFQETTEDLSVPHLMCWRTEGTFTTARCCCGVFMILAPDTKPQTYFTYFLDCWIGNSMKWFHKWTHYNIALASFTPSWALWVFQHLAHTHNCFCPQLLLDCRYVKPLWHHYSELLSWFLISNLCYIVRVCVRIASLAGWAWFVVRALYVRERNSYLILSFILSQCRDLRMGVMWEDFRVLVTARAREFWIFWSLFIWDCGRLSELQ